MDERIREALQALDPDRDEDWTSDGLPDLAAVCAYLGEDVTREEVDRAAPGFARANPEVAEVESGHEDLIDAAPTRGPAHESPPAPEPPPAAPAEDDEDLDDTAPGKRKPAQEPSEAPALPDEPEEPSSPLEAAQARVARLQALRHPLVAQRNQIQAKIGALDGQIGRAEAEIAALERKPNQLDETRRVIAQGIKDRAARLAAVGAGMVHRSPIDAAMAGPRRGFGLRRPVYPQAKTTE